MAYIFISLMAKDVENDVYTLASYKSSSKKHSSFPLFIYKLDYLSWILKF